MSSPLAAPPRLVQPPERSPSRIAGVRRYHLDRVIPNHATLTAVLAITATLLALAYGMNHNSYLVWGGFWVAPVLFIFSLPVAYRTARRDGEVIGRIVVFAAALKVSAAPLLRYWMAFSLYGGSADASRYHDAGKVLAPLFRHGIYHDLGQISGTRFMEILTGQIYAFTWPTSLGGFMVFSWFGFLGCHLFYRAFRTAFPDGDGRRYALLVFFFPTLLFWPSSIGKEAFMMLVLGAAALGAAELLIGRLRGIVWLGLGLWGAAVVRPHMALLVGAGLVLAVPIAMRRGGASREGRQRGLLGSAVLVLALLLAGSALIGVAESFFGMDSLNKESTQEVLDRVEEQTAEGGSSFTNLSPNNPVGFAFDSVTILFRPFPNEAHNVMAMFAAAEGVALLVLCVVSRRRVARLPRELLRRPYAVFSVVYTFAFLYAFSSVLNFGILARQRSQLLPVLFVLICLPQSDEQSARAQ